MTPPFDVSRYQDALTIQRVLFSAKTIAVVGLSKNELRASYFVVYYLRRHGYRVIPVTAVPPYAAGMASVPISTTIRTSTPTLSHAQAPGQPAEAAVERYFHEGRRASRRVRQRWRDRCVCHEGAGSGRNPPRPSSRGRGRRSSRRPGQGLIESTALTTCSVTPSGSGM